MAHFDMPLGFRGCATLAGHLVAARSGLRMSFQGTKHHLQLSAMSSNRPFPSRLHHFQGEFLEIPELVHEIIVVVHTLAKAHPVVPGVTGAHHGSLGWGNCK